MDIKKFEDELKVIAEKVMWKYGNATIDDIVQDTYFEAMEAYFNAVIEFPDLKKGVLDICQGVAFGYYNRERKNVSKPIGTFNSAEKWASMGDAYLWEFIEDNTGNPLKKLEAIDEIGQIKQYKGKWLSFENAKEVVHTKQFRTIDEWETYCEKGCLSNIPHNPNEVYKKFISWDDWFGIKYFSYQDCLNWVKNNLSIVSKDEWSSIIDHLPYSVPLAPDQFYKETDEWVNWDVFLGQYENKEWEKLYLSYDVAADWVNENLTKYRLTEKTWNDYTNNLIDGLPELPKNIPTEPHVIYKNKGWVNYFNWLGSAKYNAKIYKHTYHACMEWVKKNIPLVKTKEAWELFVTKGIPIKKPDFIPHNPDVIYRGFGWVGWSNFFRIGSFYTHIDSLFGTNAIRIKHMGTKMWVIPLSRCKDEVTGKVISLFTSVPQNTEIVFKVSEIVQFDSGGKRRNNSEVQTILKEKYKSIV